MVSYFQCRQRLSFHTTVHCTGGLARGIPLYTSPQTSPTPPTLTPPPPHPPIPLPRVTKEMRTLRDTTLPNQHILSKLQNTIYRKHCYLITSSWPVSRWRNQQNVLFTLPSVPCVICHQYRVCSVVKLFLFLRQNLLWPSPNQN